MVDDRRVWSLAELRALPQEEQITRHVCEGWSQVGQWSGVPLHFFLRRVGADLRAKYVAFRCFDDYWTSIDMPSALHPQTILTLDFEQKPLEPPWGAPLRLRIPTKLGFKNPKYITSIAVTNDYPGGYWEERLLAGSKQKKRDTKSGITTIHSFFGLAFDRNLEISAR